MKTKNQQKVHYNLTKVLKILYLFIISLDLFEQVQNKMK